MTVPVMQRGRPAVVLLAEDNPDHVFLTEESFRAARLRVDLRHAENGEQALKYLRRQPPYEDAPRPDLVLLDLHMPRVDGYEVMEAIRADDELKSLAVVVLTTSADVLDVQRMYRLGCSSYITKPVGFIDFTRLINQLGNYWFELVVLP